MTGETWVFLAAGLGLAGTAVLVVAGARVIVAARKLSREIAAARAMLEPRTARLRAPGG